MIFNYSGLQSTGQNLIRRFGSQYTFTRFSDTRNADATVTRTETNYNAYAVKDEFNSSERANWATIQGDVKLIAENATYKIGDKVTIDSKVYKIQDFEIIKPGGAAIIYILQLRK